MRKIDQDILFLPLEYKYEQTHFCGTGGVAVVLNWINVVEV